MMQTEIITITDVKAQQADLARAGKVLRGGGLVAFPTETVYGLGANGLDADACARIYEAKGRPSDNPLILHVSDRAMVEMVAAEVTPMAEKLLAAFMPGPITLILRRKIAELFKHLKTRFYFILFILRLYEPHTRRIIVSNVGLENMDV